MRTATVWTTVVAVLALAPAAWAAPQQNQDRYDRYDHHDRQDRDERGSRNPDWRLMRHYAIAAQQIDDTATQIHEQFERNNRRPNPREDQAMAALHALNESASDFHESAGNRDDPEQSQADFAVLLTSFYAAGEAMRGIPQRPYVTRGMNRIEALMGELTQGYGRFSEFQQRGYGSRGHRRYSGGYHSN